MYTLPAKSTVTPEGKHNPADVAWLPSPLKLQELSPPPAMVVIIPVEAVTLRMRLLLVSAM